MGSYSGFSLHSLLNLIHFQAYTCYHYINFSLTHTTNIAYISLSIQKTLVIWSGTWLCETHCCWIVHVCTQYPTRFQEACIAYMLLLIDFCAMFVKVIVNMDSKQQEIKKLMGKMGKKHKSVAHCFGTKS